MIAVGRYSRGSVTFVIFLLIFTALFLNLRLQQETSEKARYIISVGYQRGCLAGFLDASSIHMGSAVRPHFAFTVAYTGRVFFSNADASSNSKFVA